MYKKPANIVLLPYLLSAAERGKFAVGAFNPRYTAMISPVLHHGGVLMQSPLIVQMAQVGVGVISIISFPFCRVFLASCHG